MPYELRKRRSFKENERKSFAFYRQETRQRRAEDLTPRITVQIWRSLSSSVLYTAALTLLWHKSHAVANNRFILQGSTDEREEEELVLIFKICVEWILVTFAWKM